MSKTESKNLRNLALVGHGSTGKTSLCESLLYVAGKTDRLGRVEDGSSVMDYEPEEQKRRISITSALNFLEWEKHKINLIDTPGDANFAFDTRSCLSAVDAALILVDAVGKVEYQTEKVWDYAQEHKLARMIFISRMDRERASFEDTLADIRKRFKDKVTPLFIPIGKEASFTGVIDLLAGKALLFDETKAAPKVTEIPAELEADFQRYREALIEDIAEGDEELMDKYLSGGELSPEELKNGLRKGVVSGTLIPLACGSATKNIGITCLLDLIVAALPSPLDRGSVFGLKPDGSPEERKPEETSPFSASVFKTIVDPYAGRLTIFRVFSGSLRPDGSFYNASRKTSERYGNLFCLEGKAQKQAEILVPGDIAAVAKLKETATGDTLCQDKFPILFQRILPPPTIMSFAIEAKTRGDEDKIVSSINRLIEEDPTLAFRRDIQTKEMILSGMGQVHIEVSIEKMRRKFGVEVNLKTPKVPYKETIKGKTNIQGKYKKQSGGRGQFGDTWLDIEPLPRGGGFEFLDKIVGGVIPQQYRPAVEKGIVEAMEEGVLAGYPMVDIKVSLVDGSYHTVDSSEMAFKIAGSLGFKKGVLACQPVILEPIVNIEIDVPEEYMGDVIGDLNSRRGRILGVDTKGNHQIIKGQAPLAELLKYAPDIRSMTSGRGTFTYETSHYEEVPSFVAEKIIAENKKDEQN